MSNSEERWTHLTPTPSLAVHQDFRSTGHREEEPETTTVDLSSTRLEETTMMTISTLKKFYQTEENI
jgi:Tfp pilus assembly PilM family ATPase